LRDALFVYVTDGAPSEGSDAARHALSVPAYRDRRREERAGELGRCGIAVGRIVDLDCPDQQAALNLAPLSRRLAALLDRHAIESVLTQPYEGGHPDHDATAFIAHAAAALARSRPQIAEMTAYHGKGGRTEWGAFLPHPEVDDSVVTVSLSAAEQGAKQLLIDCHASQRDTLRDVPLGVERYRRAPAYDFTSPPHPGPLGYDARPWGMSGTRFCELAREALVELGLRDPR
jgi:LmbE family N-acetylglucosaminyl deacetylase